jgi:hypothetical protein
MEGNIFLRGGEIVYELENRNLFEYKIQFTGDRLNVQLKPKYRSCRLFVEHKP